MEVSTQERYRPIVEKLLATAEARLAEIAPQLVIEPALQLESPTSAVPSGVALAGSPAVKPLLDDRLRLQLALQRLNGGYFGRCIRCGRDLTRVQLEREPAALTCATACRLRRR